MVHHKGQGAPDFKIRIIKYCKDALSRQVGEAVRISYRGQPLNSKSVYNRSWLSRLVLEEENEEEQIRDDAQEDEETPELGGLTGLTGVWKTGEKRSQERQDVQQQPRRKRRKLKFDILDDDWGCMATGEDLDRIEQEETARSSFLMAGDRKGWKTDKNQELVYIWVGCKKYHPGDSMSERKNWKVHVQPTGFCSIPVPSPICCICRPLLNYGDKTIHSRFEQDGVRDQNKVFLEDKKEFDYVLCKFCILSAFWKAFIYLMNANYFSTNAQ
jgi:hypothetical protein